MEKIKLALFMLAIAAVACLHADAQVFNDQYEIAAFPDLDSIQSPIKPAGPEWMNTAAFYCIHRVPALSCQFFIQSVF